MKAQFDENYNKIISVENLLSAWQEFIKGKKNKKDVQEFSLHLMDNIFSLHRELINHTYKHGGYQAFKINDPKPRDIHKAKVKDRLLHHAIYRILYPFFDKTFISDSYSCRNNKGAHRAINKLKIYFHKASENNTRTCWVLKCDIKKFFANIDHEILIKILQEYIPDKNIIWLLEEVINSFNSNPLSISPLKRGRGIGLPLGNLTSQLFVNIYMNKFDQFLKHKLKTNYYIRYADDFVILSKNKEKLEKLILSMKEFLENELKLDLHPDKISIKTFSSGIDFLGMMNFPKYRILRTKTKRRMFKRIAKNHDLLQKKLISNEKYQRSLQSYLGILKYCEGRIFEEKMHDSWSYAKI